MLKQGPTILVVTLVTLVIWLFAEGENIRRDSLVATVQIVPPANSNMVAWVQGDAPWDGRVSISASGATIGIDNLRARLRQPVLLTPGMDGFSSTPGDHALDLRTLLRALPELRETGVSIEETEPRTIIAHADVLETIELPIKVEVAAAELDGAPEPNPARVSMQIPSLARSRLTPDTSLIARIGPDLIAGIVRGRRETIQAVPIELPQELQGVRGYKLAVPSARVALTLRERTATEVIPSVPVQIRIAPVQLDRWRVTIPESDQFLRDVRITGPSEEIDRIRRGDLRVIAMVTLSAQELASRITSKAATFSELPTSLQFQVEDPIVALSITPVPESPSPVTPPGGPTDAPAD